MNLKHCGSPIQGRIEIYQNTLLCAWRMQYHWVVIKINVGGKQIFMLKYCFFGVKYASRKRKFTDRNQGI